MASMNQPLPPLARRWRADPISRLCSLAPFALVIYVALFAQPLLAVPLFEPPRFIGLPVSAWWQIAVLTWAGVGAWVVWTTRSRLKSALALVLCTTLSTLLVLFGPALLLILQNSGS